MIGGASAILGYNVIKETNDVDLDGEIEAGHAACVFSLNAKDGSGMVVSNVDLKP